MGYETYRFKTKVTGKPRPRFSLRGNSVSVYTPSDYMKYQEAIASEYVAQGGSIHGGPIFLTLDIYRALPKSKSPKIIKEHDVYKPDIDNIAKGFLDALTGVAYYDDRQVVSLSITKYPRAWREEIAVMILEEIGELENEYNK